MQPVATPSAHTLAPHRTAILCAQGPFLFSALPLEICRPSLILLYLFESCLPVKMLLLRCSAVPLAYPPDTRVIPSCYCFLRTLC